MDPSKEELVPAPKLVPQLIHILTTNIMKQRKKQAKSYILSDMAPLISLSPLMASSPVKSCSNSAVQDMMDAGFTSHETSPVPSVHDQSKPKEAYEDAFEAMFNRLSLGLDKPYSDYGSVSSSDTNMVQSVETDNVEQAELAKVEEQKAIDKMEADLNALIEYSEELKAIDKMEADLNALIEYTEEEEAKLKSRSRLVVHNIAAGATEEELRDIFGCFKGLVDIKFFEGRHPVHGTRAACVTFARPAVALAVADMYKVHDVRIFGLKFKVRRALDVQEDTIFDYCLL